MSNYIAIDGGKKQIKEAMFEILKQETDCKIACVPDAYVTPQESDNLHGQRQRKRA